MTESSFSRSIAETFDSTANPQVEVYPCRLRAAQKAIISPGEESTSLDNAMDRARHLSKNIREGNKRLSEQLQLALDLEADPIELAELVGMTKTEMLAFVDEWARVPEADDEM